jgi:hypothetical protein
MGWFGIYCNKDLKSIKKALEQDLNFTHIDGTVQTLLYHSFKLGISYMAIEHKKNEDKTVFAMICLWKYSNSEVMIKTMDETVGPCYYDPPMKLLKMLTPTIYSNSIEWRKECWKKYKNIPSEYK